MFGGVVDERGLVFRIHGRDGDAVDALGQQIVYDPLLFGGSPVRGDSEFGGNAGQFVIGLLDPPLGNRPKIGRVIRNEGEFQFLAGAALRPAGREKQQHQQ